MYILNSKKVYVLLTYEMIFQSFDPDPENVEIKVVGVFEDKETAENYAKKHIKNKTFRRWEVLESQIQN